MAGTDPYGVLGIAKEATEAEIRSAYRKLAKQLHPDLNPGDKSAEDRFKQVSAAYELLSDKEKRAQFDRGEIDAEGQPQQARGWYRPHAESDAGARYASSAGFEDLGEMFSDLFGQRGGGGGAGGGRRTTMQFPGEDVSYTLPVEFVEAAVGAKKRVTMPDGKVLDITVPEGISDRQMLRLKGQGGPGYNGGPPGDAYVEIHLQPHAFFTRKDMDVHLELPVTLGEAVLGGRIEVPTVRGPVAMTVPKGANTGTTLRLKGRGIKSGGTTGDQYVKLKLVLPEPPDGELETLVAEWAPQHPYDPRAGHEERAMIDLDLLCTTLGAQTSDVHGWIAAGWVRPAGSPERYLFAEADIARVRLIVELRYELSVEEETLPLVLSLLDQVYGLRRELTALARAVSDQPEEVRKAIAQAMK